MSLRKIIVPIFILLAGILNAQSVEEVQQFEKKYRGFNVVNLLNRSHIRVSINKNDEVEIAVTPTLKRLYLSNSAASSPKSSIGYSTNFELSEVSAISLIPKGKKFSKEKVEKFATKTEFSPGIFHDGSLSTNFFYPSLVKGSMTELEYTLTTTIPQFLNPMYIENFYPTERREIEIEFDNDIEMVFTVHNGDPSKYAPIIEKGKKTTTWKWAFNDVPAYDYDENSPPLSYYSPVIIPRITSYHIDGETKNVLSNLDDFYSWCYSFLEKTDKEPSPAIKTIVDSIKSTANGELETIEKIYFWVQDHIKYVAFEEGMQGFVPDNAAAVCDKRFGDCKGMTSLLYTMLNYAGIEAYFTWIGTRDMPYSQAMVPSPASQNHMILTYKYKGKYYFMDGTADFSPAGEPTSMILGKEALVGIDENKYELIPVEAPPAEYSTFKDSIYIVLNPDSSISGRARSSLTGYYKSGWLSRIKTRTDDEVKDIMDNFLQRGNNKFKLDTFHMSDIKNRQDPFVIDYEFTLDDYANIHDSLALINMNLNPLYLDRTLKSDRKTPYNMRYKSKNSIVVVMEIPEGYKVDYIPNGEKYANDLFEFSFEVEQKNGQIIQRLNQKDNFLLLDKEHFPDWNEMIKKLTKAQRESISLIKK